MIRRPPRSTLTYTRFHYTTLFLSPRHFGRIDEILVFEASEPAEAIADDDAAPHRLRPVLAAAVKGAAEEEERRARFHLDRDRLLVRHRVGVGRSEEHTSELQSLVRNSYAVFCLKKQKLAQISAQHVTPPY